MEITNPALKNGDQLSVKIFGFSQIAKQDQDLKLMAVCYLA